MRTLILVSFLFIVQLSFGQKINEKDAIKIANSFLSKTKSLKLKNAKIISEDSIIPVVKNDTIFGYVVSLTKGFLITSVDKRLAPIIMYSNNSDLFINDNIDNVKYQFLISDLRNRLNLLSTQSEEINTRNIEEWGKLLNNNYEILAEYQQFPEENSTSTGGWIETTWKQRFPYNKYCPIDQYGNRFPTGCVPTAISQILFYHKYIGENILTTANKYFSNDISIDSDSTKNDFPSFSKLNQQMDTIRAKFANGNELTEDEIAYLNFMIGIATQANYNSGGTGTGNIIDPLKNFFGFSKITDNTANWWLYGNDGGDIVSSTHPHIRLAINNIKSGYPCLLTLKGNPILSSHIVIIDGYNTNDFFHINFGWGESSPNAINDAWYLLPNYPSNYLQGQVLIGNIIPDKPIVSLSNKELLFQSKDEIKSITLTGDNTILQTTGIGTDFLLSVNGTNFINNLENIEIDGELAIYIKYVGDSIVQNSLVLKMNGIPTQVIKLTGVANGVFLNNENFPDELTDIKPYYVNEYIKVDAPQNIKISKGVKIFFFRDGGLYLNNGATIEAIGDANSFIEFDAVNTDESWRGITIEKNLNNKNIFKYCKFINRTLNVVLDNDPLNTETVSLHNAQALFENCYFINNYRALKINNFPYYNSFETNSTKIVNCVFANNDEALWMWHSDPIVEFCTFTNNITAFREYEDNVKSIYRNSIIYGNKSDFLLNGNYDVFSRVSNCYIKESDSDTLESPCFKAETLQKGIQYNEMIYDWSLKVNSPVKNQGNKSNLLPNHDIAGNLRVHGLFADLGAFEIQEDDKSIKIEPQNLIDFESVYLNDTVQKTIYIYNPDFNPLTINQITLTPNNEAFKLERSLNSNTVIHPLQKDSIIISFIPTELKRYAGNIEIKSDAINISEIKLQIQGIGYYGTLVKGNLSGVWKKENSPYIIGDSCRIESNNTLTVEGGVEIIYAGSFPLQVNNGKLYLMGEKDDSIKIRSIASVPDVAIDIKMSSFLNDFPNFIMNNASVTEFRNFIYAYNSNLEINDCRFTKNIGTSIDAEQSGFLIQNCVFRDNKHVIMGGLNHYNPANKIVTGCKFINNITDSYLLSLGSFFGEEGKVVFRDNIVMSNRTLGNSSLIGFSAKDVNISNNIISNNYFSNFNLIGLGGNIQFNKNQITNNGTIHCAWIPLINIQSYTYRSSNAGYLTVESNSSFLNNTICNNLFGNYLIISPNNIELQNNIFWKNKNNSIGKDQRNDIDVNQLSAFYNLAQDGNLLSTSNIIGEDPCFKSIPTTLGYIDSIYDCDWSLTNTSPCIDAGNPDGFYNDLENNSNPNKALFPSQSTIRNDIGSFGGYYGCFNKKRSIAKTICEGENYLGWSTSGIYENLFETSLGCDSTIIINLNVANSQGVPDLVQEGDILISNFDNGNQWYCNGEKLEGENNPTCVIAKSGNYHLIVTNPNGCSESSTIKDIFLTTVSDYRKTEFSIYPNPVKDKITIESSPGNQEIDIIIYNVTGQVVYQKHFTASPIQIDIKHFNPGLYLLCTNLKQKEFVKIIKE